MKTTPANPQVDVSVLQALLAEKEAEIAPRDKDIAGFKAQLRGRDFLIEKLKHQLAGIHTWLLPWASGAIELIARVNAIRHKIGPPTIGYTMPDPDCDLDVTPNQERERRMEKAMSNAFAFGGLNAVIAMRNV